MFIIDGTVKLAPVSIGAEGGELQTGDQTLSVVLLNVQTQSGTVSVVVPPENVDQVCQVLQNAKSELENSKPDLAVVSSMDEAKAVADVVDKFK